MCCYRPESQNTTADPAPRNSLQSVSDAPRPTTPAPPQWGSGAWGVESTPHAPDAKFWGNFHQNRLTEISWKTNSDQKETSQPHWHQELVWPRLV